MLKRFGIPALALASVLAITAPTVTLAADRGGERGGREVARQDFRGRGDDHFDRGGRRFDRDDRGGFNFGVGFYADPTPVPIPVPVPAPSGYYDQYGIWHPYGY